MTETKARYLEYTDKVILDEETKKPVDGDVLKGGVIFRFTNGKLHGQESPAISTEDGHLEFWRNGKLHREGKPAVKSITLDEFGNTYEEYWENGVRLS